MIFFGVKTKIGGITIQECIEMSVFAPKKQTIIDPDRYQRKTVEKSNKPRVSICNKVKIRQSSVKNEEGDTIPNTAICTDHEHCPLQKSCFFDTLIDDIWKATDIDTDLEDLVIQKLEESFTDHRSISEAAVWVISYLEDRKKYLIENKTRKVLLGPHTLKFKHIFIIEKIIEILENIINEYRCSEFVGCAISYHDSIKLIF